MRIFTTLPNHKPRAELHRELGWMNILTTFNDYRKANGLNHYEKWLAMLKECELEGARLLFDSGAFSAWNSGNEISVEQLTKFILAVQGSFDFFSDVTIVGLDKIPGTQGQQPTTEEMDSASQITYENYHYMKARLPGLTVMPVFHEGDNFEFLHRYIEEKVPYLGISPSNDSQTAKRQLWLTRVFQVLPDNIKTHGFAVTSPKLMRNNRFTTVDSITPVALAGYGKVQTPFGTYVFSDRPQSYSLESGNQDEVFELLEKREREALWAWIESLELKNITLHTLKENFINRTKVNMAYFQILEKECTASQKQAPAQAELFGITR